MEILTVTPLRRPQPLSMTLLGPKLQKPRILGPSPRIGVLQVPGRWVSRAPTVLMRPPHIRVPPTIRAKSLMWSLSIRVTRRIRVVHRVTPKGMLRFTLFECRMST